MPSPIHRPPQILTDPPSIRIGTRWYPWGIQRLVSTYWTLSLVIWRGGVLAKSKVKVPRSGQLFISGGGGGSVPNPRKGCSSLNLSKNFALPLSGSPCIADSLSHTTYVETNDPEAIYPVHFVCLVFCLSLNGQMAIQRKNSHWITIWPFWKSQLNGRMQFSHLTNFIQIWWIIIRWLFSFKRKRNLRYFENTLSLSSETFCNGNLRIRLKQMTYKCVHKLFLLQVINEII